MVAAIIDSHPVFLNGLTQFLYQLYPNVQVVRSTSLSAFNNSRGDLRPDFIILGVNNFYKPTDVKTLNVINRSLTSTAVVVFYDDISMALPLLKTGASGFIAKKGNPEELVDCLENILHGKRYLNNEIFEWIVRPVN